MNRVTLRIERDDYKHCNTILACFPDDRANLGRIACVPLYFADCYGVVFFEAYTEVGMEYYYSTRPLTDEAIIRMCLMELEKRYNERFRIVKKIIKK